MKSRNRKYMSDTAPVQKSFFSILYKRFLTENKSCKETAVLSSKFYSEFRNHSLTIIHNSSHESAGVPAFDCKFLGIEYIQEYSFGFIVIFIIKEISLSGDSNSQFSKYMTSPYSAVTGSPRYLIFADCLPFIFPFAVKPALSPS